MCFPKVFKFVTVFFENHVRAYYNREAQCSQQNSGSPGRREANKGKYGRGSVLQSNQGKEGYCGCMRSGPFIRIRRKRKERLDFSCI